MDTQIIVVFCLCADMLKSLQHYEDRQCQMSEHRRDSFEPSVMLPTNVIADQATADFENGILTIPLPKAAEAKPKTITVNAK